MSLGSHVTSGQSLLARLLFCHLYHEDNDSICWDGYMDE